MMLHLQAVRDFLNRAQSCQPGCVRASDAQRALSNQAVRMISSRVILKDAGRMR